MVNYILKRTAYSVLIIFGVLIITFVLFRVAAGDPAATVLGKNPTAREIEDMRDALGSNKPLLFGKWRQTEKYSSIVFDKERDLATVALSGSFEFREQALYMTKGTIRFKQNFVNSEPRTRLVCRSKGKFSIGEHTYDSDSFTTHTIIIDKPGDIILKVGLNANNTLNRVETAFRSISFYKPQISIFDSQLMDSLEEVVKFSTKFPYVSFFNFGDTLITREPIRRILWNGMWPSLSIMLPIFIGELLIGVILSLIAAAFKDSIIDKSIVILSIAGMSVSYLVFIIFGQWYLGYYFGLFPVWGYGSFEYIYLPVIIGIISGVGGGVRFYRTVFINELNREYLRTALAKGCGPLSIYGKHLLRNALIPIITRASSIIPFLFTGSLLLESFFGIPGLGYAGYNALANSDLQLVKALVVLSAFLFVIINLLADIAYAWADPRIRLS